MEKYEVGKIIKCQVTGIENYGIFVNVDEFYSGLIHISEITKGFVRNINDYVKIDETIYCKILEIDEINLQMKLTIKDLDYKVDGAQKGLKEEGMGFKPLEEKLPIWTAEKLDEIK